MGVASYMISFVLVVIAALLGGLGEVFPAWMMIITEDENEEAAYGEEDEEVCM